MYIFIITCLLLLEIMVLLFYVIVYFCIQNSGPVFNQDNNTECCEMFEKYELQIETRVRISFPA